jgi:hypothetical protein
MGEVWQQAGGSGAVSSGASVGGDCQLSDGGGSVWGECPREDLYLHLYLHLHLYLYLNLYLFFYIYGGRDNERRGEREEGRQL